ncbi:MAG: alpha-L-rhamnosidase N-terminal domain-containing protein [Pseudomonadota bacterium]
MTRSKCHFIWLKDQAIDHNAMFMTIHGAPLRRDTDGINRWVLARGKYFHEQGATETKLKITCDGKYKLWINGTAIGYGPYRSNPNFQRIDEIEISRYLKEGANQIAVLVHVPGQDLAWYETNKSAWQTVFGDGGLYCEIISQIDGISKISGSDESWKIMETGAWTKEIPLSGWGQDFIEELDARVLPENWQSLAYDDKDWPDAQIMVAEGNQDANARGWGKVTPFPILIDNKTAPMHQEEILPSQHLWSKSVLPRPDLGIKERIYAEELCEAESEIVQGGHNLLSDNTTTIIKTVGASDTALLFGFSPYRVGRPFIEFEANGGEIIEFAISEKLPGEYGVGVEGDGLRQEGALFVSHVCRYIARKGKQRFEKFNPVGTRALQLMVRNAPDGIIVHKLGLNAVNCRVEHRGSFESSDSLLNEIWKIGRHTLQMCAQDGWIDCPNRESRQWLGDGIVMFDMAHYTFGQSIIALHKAFLTQICEGQRIDGLARMVSPGDIRATAITIPDYSLHWIIGTKKYLDVTNDLATVENFMPSLEKAIIWFEKSRHDNLLIANVPEWHFIEWANIERKGYSMAFNALYAGALSAMADLWRVFGYEARHQKYFSEYQQVCDAINQHFYCWTRKLYCDSVDEHSLEKGPKSSQHGNALALLYGIAPRNIVSEIVTQITDDKRLKLTDAPPIMAFCPEFDDKTDIVRANSFFSHFVYAGIANAGWIKWVVADIKRLFAPMIATGTTTLWEAFEPIASLCHGFSATPIYQLSRFCLGVTAITPGYKTFAFQLTDCDLDWAKGSIPTQFGLIEISWTKIGKKIEFEIQFPRDCEIDLSASNGIKIYAQTNTSAQGAFAI